MTDYPMPVSINVHNPDVKGVMVMAGAVVVNLGRNEVENNWSGLSLIVEDPAALRRLIVDIVAEADYHLPGLRQAVVESLLRSGTEQ